MDLYELKDRPRGQLIEWPWQTPGKGGQITYPGERSTKDIAPDSRVILETNDDDQLCAVVELNDAGTKFSGRVVERYSPDALTTFGSGEDADQPIDFTDQNIFTVQYLA